MSTARTFAFVALLILSPHWGISRDASVTNMSKAKLAPFFKENCIRCHGPEKEKGQLRLDEISYQITGNDEAQRWQDILDVLNGGDMPPEDEEQPTSDELSATLDVLTNNLLTARKRLTDSGGEITMRRLNRREYAKTIEELFGFRIPAEMIPEDGEVATFDTVGSEQFFTSSHFEKYLELGKEIATQGFMWAGRPPFDSKTNRREPEAHVTDRLREKLADLDNKMRMKNEGKSWREMGFKDEGEAEIVFSQFKNRAGKPREYLTKPLVESGIYFAGVNNETKRFGTNHGGCDPRATYRLRVRAGILGDPPEIRKFIRLTDNVGTVGILKVQGTTENPEVVEMTYRPRFGEKNVNFSVEENRADIRVLDAYLKRLKSEEEAASIWMDWLETEGPFYGEERFWFEKLLYPDAPGKGKPNRMAWNFGNARELVEGFAYEAFRHQKADPAYVDKLMVYFEGIKSEGSNFNNAMAEVFAVVLASPQFLFIEEAGGEDETERRKLDDRELAVRLAYFLWSSPPDNDLYSCAENGTIQKPEVLREQIERMLDDPRAEAFVSGFASQWGELDRFDAITVDENKFFLFNKGIRYSARQEVLEFFKVMIAENLPVSNFVDSDFVVVNSLLGQHYGIDGVNADAFEKVKLPAESPRGGILGQTAFLTLGSNGERSSPVIRGAFVMEKLLHDKPAPPPPNVPELGAGSKKPATNRQMVELHQSQAVCASCHRKMDVIGFGLENFDPIGKWRETELVGRKEVPIETAGKLPGGAVFDDVDGLKSVLLNQKEGLATELVEALLAYSLGRTIEFSDADDVEEIIKNLRAEEYPLRSMIHEIASSRLFHTK